MQIWASTEADNYFQSMQKKADTANEELKEYFRQVMRNIAKEMNVATRFTDIRTLRRNEPHVPPLKVLDLCMAPGSFTEEVRQFLPLADMNGISLPLSLGGHKLLLERGPLLKVEFLDITMLAAEMGFTLDDVPSDHPDQNLFLFKRPFFGETFDLILCDGNVLRTHQRQEYREKMEPTRLCASQLVFALQHIRTGGNFVMLLHRAETMPVMKIIYAFTKFSASVQLFKPARIHAIRSSFYIVAKGVNPQSEAALRVVEEWKEVWASSTLRFSTWEEEQPTDDEVEAILAEFGEKFIEICEPMWKIQADAMFYRLRNGFSTSYLKF